MSAGRVYRPKVRRAYDPTHQHFPHCSPEKGCYFETSKWWVRYSVRGKVYSEPSNTDRKADAQRMLRERLTEREVGKVIGRPDRVSFADLRRGIEQSYEHEGNRSLKRAKQALAHLEKVLGAETLALDITRQRVKDYIDTRFREGAGRGTVRYEVALLNRAFSVAVDSGVLAMRPEFPPPAPAEARSGFFTEGDLAALLIELPDYLRPIVRFAALVGWRKEVVVSLQWADVDWEGQVVTIPGSRTKQKKAILFPFGSAPELRELLEAQREVENGPFVFHEGGRRIHSFYKAWKAACKRAGMAGRLFHDLRRTAARDMRRAGVDTKVIMKLAGWETDAMFHRYNIVDEVDLAESVAKRFPQAAREGA